MVGECLASGEQPWQKGNAQETIFLIHLFSKIVTRKINVLKKEFLGHLQETQSWRLQTHILAALLSSHASDRDGRPSGGCPHQRTDLDLRLV